MPATNKSSESALAADSDPPGTITEKYQKVRSFSQTLCEPLETEDYVIQTMEDVSPTKWHLAHTSWFFETFILAPHLEGYRSPNPRYSYLFNSYYNAVGDKHCRPKRGFASRPTVKEVFAYRKHVDEGMRRLLEVAGPELLGKLAPVIDIGINHEQQHQELLLTDIKHVFANNPLYPAYKASQTTDAKATPLRWHPYAEGLEWVGHGGDGFAYDNEGPRHRAFLHGFELGSRLVTNAEYMAFMADGGYARPELWLSDGWATVQERGWERPLYWERRDDEWWNFTLSGLRRVVESEPVCHVSYYEADAYARWAGARLATEQEWEVAAARVPIAGNFADDGRLHPAPPAEGAGDGPAQMFGDVWEWTQSPYSPYPGYKAAEGALGEYNGKFMCNQFVLRGGSCGTSQDHVRRTYRNFFHADARWQFMGIRLAKDAEG